MPRRQKLNITPEQLTGYRPVPGYGKVSYFDLATGQHKSGRRYYNPAIPVGDPNREIGDSTYFRLKREADAETKEAIRRENERRSRFKERNEEQIREAAGYVPRRDSQGRIVRNKRGQIIYDVPPGGGTSEGNVPGNIQERYARLQDVREQIGLYNYSVEQGGRWLMSDRRPGGQLSNLLEQLGWRPRGAPWMVGESGQDHSRIALGVDPAQQMRLWKSQSSLRTGAA